MNRTLKSFLSELIYIYTNYFVANIPIWRLRKVLYSLLGMKIGKKSRILMKTVIVSPWKIQIGENTVINEYCYLDGRGGLNIGSNCSIAVYTKVLSAGHYVDDNLFSYYEKSVVIGDNVACFANCCILGGASIEDGCVFYACSVIPEGHYKPNGVFSGTPVKYIRQRLISEEYKPKAWTVFLR